MFNALNEHQPRQVPHKLNPAVSIPHLASTRSYFLFRGKSHRGVVWHDDAALFGAWPVSVQVYSQLKRVPLLGLHGLRTFTVH